MSLNPISINGFGVDLGEFTSPNNRLNQFIQNVIDNFYDIADTVISGDVVWDTANNTANNTDDYTAVVYIPDTPLVTSEAETVTTYSENEAIDLLDKTFSKLINYALTQHEINDTINLTTKEVNELKHELYVFVVNTVRQLQFVDFV